MPRLSRANSFGGSVAASEDQHPSLYIAKGVAEPAPSDVDSDTMRKQTALNLKKEFENYQQQQSKLNHHPPSNSEFTSNQNVEFETISNGSNGLKS